jgi:Putative neutral zinc metallopeptidase
MRIRSLALIFALVAALAATGCGSSKKKTSRTGPTPTPAAKNKQLKAPATTQPASASKKPNKKTIATLLQTKKPGKGKSPQLKGLEGKSIEEKLQIFANDIGGFWQQAFSGTQVQFQPVTVNLITQPQQTGCGTLQPTGQFTTYYCSADHTVNLSVPELTTVSQDPRYGDAVVAADVAVSFGFHVEAVTGIRTKQSDQANAETAFCLSGVWAYTVQARGLFDPGDVDKIASNFQGNTAAFANAFNVGLTTGDPSKCVQPSGSPGLGGAHP